MVHWGNTVARRESKAFPRHSFPLSYFHQFCVFDATSPIERNEKDNARSLSKILDPPARASASVLRKFHTDGAVRKEQSLLRTDCQKVKRWRATSVLPRVIFSHDYYPFRNNISLVFHCVFIVDKQASREAPFRSLVKRHAQEEDERIRIRPVLFSFSFDRLLVYKCLTHARSRKFRRRRSELRTPLSNLFSSQIDTEGNRIYSVNHKPEGWYWCLAGESGANP